MALKETLGERSKSVGCMLLAPLGFIFPLGAMFVLELVAEWAYGAGIWPLGAVCRIAWWVFAFGIVVGLIVWVVALFRAILGKGD